MDHALNAEQSQEPHPPTSSGRASGGWPPLPASMRLTDTITLTTTDGAIAMPDERASQTTFGRRPLRTTSRRLA